MIPELTLSDLDGVDELWFDTLADLRAVARDPAFCEPLSRSQLLLTEEHVIFDRDTDPTSRNGFDKDL